MLENPINLLKGLAAYAPELYVRIAVVKLLEYIEEDAVRNAPALDASEAIDQEDEEYAGEDISWDSALSNWDVMEILSQAMLTGEVTLDSFELPEAPPSAEEIEQMVVGFHDKLFKTNKDPEQKEDQ